MPKRNIKVEVDETAVKEIERKAALSALEQGLIEVECPNCGGKVRLCGIETKCHCGQVIEARI